MVTIKAIENIISLQLGIREINPTQRLVEDLSAESADLVNIIGKVEEKFQLIFPEEDIANLRTVEDIFQVALHVSQQ